jgi:hypothetical protein
MSLCPRLPFFPSVTQRLHCGLYLPHGIELGLVDAMPDEIHPNLPASRDQNAYAFGCMGGHKTVMAVMPQIGNSAAATVAIRLLNDFSLDSVWLADGVGGVPGQAGEDDVRLGMS